MIAEILSIGTELLMGQIANTDAQFIARCLSEAGITLHRQTTVGDNPERLLEALSTALSRADIVITTGGIGPTSDDITKELTARALALPMERSPQAEAMVRSWFASRGHEMTENNLRQADFPKGAMILPNGFGTAPGCIVPGGSRTVINLPGPPRELVPMMRTGVMPFLAAQGQGVILSRYLRIFGMGESTVESLTSDLMRTLVNPTVAPYCSLGEVQLRLTAYAESAAEADRLLDPLEAALRERLDGVIYAVTDRADFAMEEALAEALLAKGWTCATAESCTGGMLASRLVNVPGISSVFLEGHVTYANEAKERILGVEAQTIARYGAVSGETARQMAEGLRLRSGANLTIATTGIAGPDGGTPEKPVGTVWLGLATEKGTQARALRLAGDRERIRTLATLHALHWMLREARG